MNTVFRIYIPQKCFDCVVFQIQTHVISTEFLISILAFYGELCKINDLKSWFGEEGSGFWLPILNLLSSLPGALKAAFFGSNMYELESVVIHFLSKCCWSHPSNQKIIATCLREIILTQKSSSHSEFQRTIYFIFKVRLNPTNCFCLFVCRSCLSALHVIILSPPLNSAPPGERKSCGSYQKQFQISAQISSDLPPTQGQTSIHGRQRWGSTLLHEHSFNGI